MKTVDLTLLEAAAHDGVDRTIGLVPHLAQCCVEQFLGEKIFIAAATDGHRAGAREELIGAQMGDDPAHGAACAGITLRITGRRKHR